MKAFSYYNSSGKHRRLH